MIGIGQKYSKHGEIISVICNIICHSMHTKCNSDTYQVERMCQQFLRSKGAEFCMKMLKIISENEGRNLDILVSCLLPVVYVADTVKEGKEWAEKNSSKIAAYSNLVDEFETINDSILKQTAARRWTSFWTDIIKIESKDRDMKMKELLEEEERERTKKAKKREKKKQKRARAQQMKTNVATIVNSDMDEQIQPKSKEVLAQNVEKEPTKQEEKKEFDKIAVPESQEHVHSSPNWTEVKGKKCQVKVAVPAGKNWERDRGIKKEKVAVARVNKDKNDAVNIQWGKRAHGKGEKFTKVPDKQLVAASQSSNGQLDYEEEFPCLVPSKSAMSNSRDMEFAAKSQSRSESRTSTVDIWDSEDDNDLSASGDTGDEERPLWVEAAVGQHDANVCDSDYWQTTYEFEENIRYNVHDRTTQRASTKECPETSPQQHNFRKTPDENVLLNMESNGTYDKTNNMPDKEMFRGFTSKLTLKDVAGTLIDQQDSTQQGTALSGRKDGNSIDTSTEFEQMCYERTTAKKAVCHDDPVGETVKQINNLCKPMSVKPTQPLIKPNIVGITGGLTLAEVEAQMFQMSNDKQNIVDSGVSGLKDPGRHSQKIAVIEPIGHNIKEERIEKQNITDSTALYECEKLIRRNNQDEKQDNPHAWSLGIGREVKAAMMKRDRVTTSLEHCNNTTVSQNSKFNNQPHPIETVKNIRGIVAPLDRVVTDATSDFSRSTKVQVKPQSSSQTSQEVGNINSQNNDNCELGQSWLINAMNIKHEEEEFAPISDLEDPADRADDKQLPSFPSVHQDNLRSKEYERQCELAMKKMQELQQLYLQNYMQTVRAQSNLMSGDGFCSDYQYYACCAGLNTKPANPTMPQDEGKMFKANEIHENAKENIIDDVFPVQTEIHNVSRTSENTVNQDFDGDISSPYPNSCVNTDINQPSVNKDPVEFSKESSEPNRNSDHGHTNHSNTDVQTSAQRVWTPRSLRWRQKLTELWNLPPRERIIIGDIVLPLQRKRFEIPFS